MIRFSFNIRIPGSNRFQRVGCWHGSTPLPNKFWELQIYKSADIIDFNFAVTARQSHSGLEISLGLLFFNVEFTVYDSRHWNSENKTWEHYDD